LLREIARKNRKVGKSSSPTVDPQTVQTCKALAIQMALVSYTLGGPGQVFSEGGGAFGGGAVRDHGEELVDLIRSTLHPDFWDVNGGPGSIVYYAPLQALVVRGCR